MAIGIHFGLKLVLVACEIVYLLTQVKILNKKLTKLVGHTLTDLP